MKFSSPSFKTLAIATTLLLPSVTSQDIKDVLEDTVLDPSAVTLTLYQAYKGDNLNVGWLPTNLDPKRASYDLYRPGRENINAWMKDLRDDMLLSELSIPGTSTSLAYHRELAGSLRTQNYDIYQQLLAGIRYFDFPLYERKTWKSRIWSDYSVCPKPHLSDCPDGWAVDNRVTTDPADVAKRNIVFLLKNAFWQRLPREFIVVRFRPDPRVLQSLLAEEKEEKLERLAEVLWRDIYDLTDKRTGKSSLSMDRLVYIRNEDEIDKLTVGRMRGKIVIITDFAWKGYMDDYHIPWKSLNVRKDVDVMIKEVGDVEKKWRAVEKNIDLAGASSAKSRLYITHASGGGKGVTPEVVATGGSSVTGIGKVGGDGRKVVKAPGRAPGRFLGSKDEPSHNVVEGINSRLLRKFKKMNNDKSSKKAGIIVMDFPSRGLTQSVIDLNF